MGSLLSSVLIFLFFFFFASVDSFEKGGRSRICKLFIGVDEPLWDHLDQNVTRVLDLVNPHIDSLNEIFTEQILADPPIDDVYFKLGRLQVMFGSCDGFEAENCTLHRDKFLSAFDRHDFRGFCLAFLFSFVDFSNGTAGYASVGTVCASTQNSGFVTLLNYGVERGLEDSEITFAHEIGHTFGAIHDESVEDPEEKAECTDKEYIMNGVYNRSDYSEGDSESMKRTFSPCSVKSMEKKLKELRARNEECFVNDETTTEVEISICGNYIVEPGEECDCGLEPEDCSDFCCYPAHISEADRAVNLTAIPCSRNLKSDCVTPPGLLFGFYLPWAFILALCVIIFLVLRYDWRRNKNFFKHVTQSNVRIVNYNNNSGKVGSIPTI